MSASIRKAGEFFQFPRRSFQPFHSKPKRHTMNGEGGFWDMLILYGPLFLALILLYQWMVERPRQKEELARLEKLRNLKKNDRVITTGGIVGIISNVKDRILTIRTAEETRLEVLRDHVQLYDPEKEKADKEKQEKPARDKAPEKSSESQDSPEEQK